MEPTINTWSPGRKIFFRVLVVYFCLYTLLLAFESLFEPLVKIAGRLLKVPARLLINSSNGSGDSTYQYVQLLCLALLAPLGGVLWSVLDRKRPGYDKLFYCFHVMLRYTLGLFMLVYGFAKISMTQFSFPTLYDLLKPLGNSSPMGLAWRFMGYSYPFNLFTGCAEALGGLLLLFRRTTTFGSLFSMTVLTNVVAMNFCYDIPVKIFSVHLLLMAIIIAAPDLNRIITFFFMNKAVPAFTGFPVFEKKWMRISRVTLKVVMIMGIAGVSVYTCVEAAREDDNTEPPLYGIYYADEFVKNSTPLPPLITDSIRWRNLVIEKGSYAEVKTMTDKMMGYNIKVDTTKKTIKFKSWKNKDSAVVNYQVIDTSHIMITGNFFNDSLSITLKKRNIKDFLLVSRGFHWINEYPFNR